MDLNLLAARLKKDYPVSSESGEEIPPRMAAVLVLLFSKNGKTHILLIKRAAGLKNHPGEISFPGGMYEEADGNLLTTALRETEEELDLKVEESSVISNLPRVQTLTGFVISPFAAILEKSPSCKINPDEVEAVLEAPLEPLLATQQKDTQRNLPADMVVFQYGPHRVWGATARILRRISMIR